MGVIYFLKALEWTTPTKKKFFLVKSWPPTCQFWVNFKVLLVYYIDHQSLSLSPALVNCLLLLGPYSPQTPHMAAPYGALGPTSHMPQMLLPTHHSVMDGYGNMAAMHGSGIQDIHAG